MLSVILFIYLIINSDEDELITIYNKYPYFFRSLFDLFAGELIRYIIVFHEHKNQLVPAYIQERHFEGFGERASTR